MNIRYFGKKNKWSTDWWVCASLMGCTNCCKVLNPPKVVGLIAPINAENRSQWCHCLFACLCIRSHTFFLEKHLILMVSWTNIHPHRNCTFFHIYCQLFCFSLLKDPNFLVLHFPWSKITTANQFFLITFPLPFVHFPLSVLHDVVFACYLSFGFFSFHHNTKSLKAEFCHFGCFFSVDYYRL